MSIVKAEGTASRNGGQGSLLLPTIVVQALVVAGIWASRTRIAAVCKEMDLGESSLTSLALGWPLPTLLTLMLAGTLMFELFSKSPSAKSTWNALALVGSLIALAAYVTGVYLPLQTILEGLS